MTEGNIITITDPDYSKCVEYSTSCWTNEKGAGKYNRGFGNKASDPYLVQRAGKLGEVAFGMIFALAPNFSYCKYGDSYDFMWKGYSVDVKTVLSATTDKGYIVYRHARGTMAKRCDLYVFCRREWEDVENRIAHIRPMGFVRECDLTDDMMGLSKDQITMNHIVNFSNLQPLENLHAIPEKSIGGNRHVALNPF